MHIVLAKQGGDGKFKGSFNRSNLHFETLRSEGGNGSSSLKQQSKIMVLEFADDAVGLVSGVPFCTLALSRALHLSDRVNMGRLSPTFVRAFACFSAPLLVNLKARCPRPFCESSRMISDMFFGRT